ncbi:MAG: hypothetical protein IT332_07470 [Ardenticatenales bacterium]|nr:hypothetical protein [Ardenticatenales bacterium]
MTGPTPAGRLLRRACPAALGIAVLAVLAGFAGGRPVEADTTAVRVKSLYVAARPDAGPPPVPTSPATAEAVLFDEGTRHVYARFAYEQAADQEIRVVVKGRGGVTVFGHGARYNGDGTATIDIDGTAVYGVLAGALSADARDAKQSAKQAAERSVGVQEYLRSAEAAVLRLVWTAELLGNVDLPPAPAAEVAEIDGSLRDAILILARAIELPPDDVAGKQRRAAQVDTMLGEVVRASTDLSAQAAQLRDLPLPSTGHHATDTFVVQVEVAGDIAVTAEFWVWGPARIQLPVLSKGATLRSR